MKLKTTLCEPQLCKSNQTYLWLVPASLLQSSPCGKLSGSTHSTTVPRSALQGGNGTGVMAGLPRNDPWEVCSLTGKRNTRR